MSVATFTRSIQSRTQEANLIKEADEIMIFCPACEAFERVRLNEGKSNQNRKFTQSRSNVIPIEAPVPLAACI